MILVVGAERAGKSLWLSSEVLGRSAWCRRIAIAAQEYDETRAEMECIIQGLEQLGGLVKTSTPQQGKWTALVRGGLEIETVSLHDGPRELTGRGKAYDVVGLVEAGRIRYDAFLVARGRVSETRGVVLMSGTLWDNWGWMANLYRAFEGPNAFEGERFSFPAWHNLEIFPGGEDDPEIARLKRILTADEFARRVGAKLVPSPARVYPEFSPSTHVAEVGMVDDALVDLVIDAGYYPSRYAALALQVVEKPYRLADGSVVRMEMIRQIDEVWEHHKTHQDVYEMCRQRPWWGRVERVYGGHETRQHPASESTREIWEALARAEGKRMRFEVVDGGLILDGVLRVKTLLKDPALGVSRYVCDAGCKGTPHEFGAYKRRTDSRGNVISDEPEDKNNDALDALRNYVVARFGLVDRERRKPKPGRARGATRG